ATAEHDGRQSLGGGVDRSRETGRSCPDNRHVVDEVGIDRSNQTDAACELVFAGIVQQLSAGTEHYRQLTGIDVKALDQGSGTGIGFRIELLRRLAIAV